VEAWPDGRDAATKSTVAIGDGVEAWPDGRDAGTKSTGAMDLTLDDDQLLLAESARQLFERTYSTESARTAEGTPDGFSSNLWQQACELGWPGIALPEEVGGAGYGVLELCVLAEELGRGAATLPLLPSYAATSTLLWAGSDAARGRWLTALGAGTAIAALALVEPGGGDERTPPALAATAAGDGWTLSGTKIAVPFGAVADVLVVSADLGGAPTLVAIAAAAPGVTRARHDTFAPTPYAAVTFADVAVAPSDVVGEPGAGAALIDRALAHQTVVDTAYAVGLARAALALSVDHASNREQFGRPIGVNQAVSHQCVDMRVEIDAMRVLTQQAAWRLDRDTGSWGRDPDEAARAVALANAYAREVLPGIFARAHQVHGAIGFTLEYDLQLFTRRAKAYELTGSGRSAHLEAVARALRL
jgi:3-oxocholest-4-en-26-oyl-CoA dehydrogenase beta subunit